MNSNTRPLFTLVTVCLLILFQPKAWSTPLSMYLHGSIDDKCEINFNYGNVIDLSSDKYEELPFSLYCNQAFGIEISSRNGGLKLNNESQPYLMGYLLEINIDKTKVNQSFDSKELQLTSQVNSFGVIPFSTKGSLKITLNESLLYAGEYSDIVEIDIFPSIHSVTK